MNNSLKKIGRPPVESHLRLNPKKFYFNQKMLDHIKECGGSEYLRSLVKVDMDEMRGSDRNVN